ncbi:helix-turn-helix domain-containing protein [Streptomyces albus]|uniref:ArsR/SmtB family transcription factor n=1 Tax=Streptomyces albus TaxID=1888 RepID=UPI000AA95A1C
MAHEERERVLDPEQDSAALKALTHPLRIRLLGMLRQDGPATATELSGRTRESSASTSYHLRVLAKYGFVAEAEHRDGRERRWRAVHAVTSWNNAAVSASPEHRAFLDVVRRAQIEHLERSLVRHHEDLAAARLGPEWRKPSGISDLVLRLTPESLGQLLEHFARHAEELAAGDASDPRAEPVVLFTAGLPVAARDGEVGAGHPESAARAETRSGAGTGANANAGADTNTGTDAQQGPRSSAEPGAKAAVSASPGRSSAHPRAPADAGSPAHADTDTGSQARAHARTHTDTSTSTSTSTGTDTGTDTDTGTGSSAGIS